MAKIWKNRIEAGTQVFSDCPERYKNEVRTLLERDVNSGVLTKEEFDYLISL